MNTQTSKFVTLGLFTETTFKITYYNLYLLYSHRKVEHIESTKVICFLKSYNICYVKTNYNRVLGCILLIQNLAWVGKQFLSTLVKILKALYSPVWISHASVAGTSVWNACRTDCTEMVFHLEQYNSTSIS